MPDKVNIIAEETVFHQNIFRVQQATLQHERFDGTHSETLTRLKLERGDSAAVVLHILPTDSLILVEQFRYPAYGKSAGWLLELPAGVVEPDEDPAATMQREILEESGYRATTLRPIGVYFLSPGGSSERIHLYYAAVGPNDQVGGGGGVASEGEDIRTVTVPVARALHDLAAGQIMDAKTAIGLQWLQLQRRI